MKALLLLTLALLVASCASSTPSKRIEENSEFHSSLNSRQKALIAEGKIENGMTTKAVYLAWGNPASQAEGQERGQTFEKWTYTRITPVYHQSLYGGAYARNSRYGQFGAGRGFNPYNSFGTEVSYVPYRSAWVKFKNGRVDSWQRGQPQ